MTAATFTKDELEKLCDAWDDFERAARNKSAGNDRETGAAFQGGRAVAYRDCAEHLRWFLGTKEGKT